MNFAIKSLRTFMSLTSGTQLGSHEITALLGKGGMGEVYRARDTTFLLTPSADSGWASPWPIMLAPMWHHRARKLRSVIAKPKHVKRRSVNRVKSGFCPGRRSFSGELAEMCKARTVRDKTHKDLCPQS